MKKIDWIGKPKIVKQVRPKPLPKVKTDVDLLKAGVGLAVGFAALGVGLAAFQSLSD